MVRVTVFILVLALLGVATGARQGTTPVGDQTETPAVRFHHVHFNTTDRSKAIEFFSSRFAAERAMFSAQQEAVRTDRGWMLFNQVSTSPPWQLTSSIWHIGWGAKDMPAEYERQLKLGTRFFEPLTDISDIGGNPNVRPGSFYYAYVDGPDRALIELNTAPNNQFGHLHLLSADPYAAVDWYVRYLGVKPRRRPLAPEPRFYRGYQIGPSVSFALDGVNVIIFPVEYAMKAYSDQWKGRMSLETTRGRTIDHIGIAIDNFDETIEKMRLSGIKPVDGERGLMGGSSRSAFIEGPDRISIELIENLARPGLN